MLHSDIVVIHDHVHIHIYIYIYVLHVYVYIYIHTYVYMYACMGTYVPVLPPILTGQISVIMMIITIIIPIYMYTKVHP